MRAPLLLCPANLAPPSRAARCSCSTTRPRCGIPAGTPAPTRPGSGGCCPCSLARARRIVTVSEFSRAELAELLGADPARIAVVPGGVDGASRPTRTRRAPAARSGSRGRTCSASPPTPRARTCGALVPAARALAAEGVELAVAGGHRPQFAAERASARCGCSAHVDDALLPGLYAGAEAFALPVALRGLRAAGAGGDGGRHARC